VNVRFEFQGKNVVVVGGSRGIGRQVCEDFLQAGAFVTYISRHPGEGLSSASHVACDLRNDDEVRNAFSNVEKIDFLINVAAINHCKPIDRIDMNEWDDVLSVNLRSYFLTCKLAIEKMKTAGFGRIVNVSSIAGRSKSIVSGAHYTSSKAGIIGLTRQIAHEVSQYGINVNAVCPSQTMTDMLARSMSLLDIHNLSEIIPARRLASTSEQSLPILFLCSDAASYITGCALDVNGGQL